MAGVNEAGIEALDCPCQIAKYYPMVADINGAYPEIK
jgi:hypothetical protein